MTTINEILTACAASWEVTTEDILGKSRRREIVNARHYARWLLKTRIGMTSTRIAELFHCTHATVLHSFDVVAAWLDYSFLDFEQQRISNTDNLLAS